MANSLGGAIRTSFGLVSSDVAALKQEKMPWGTRALDVLKSKDHSLKELSGKSETYAKEAQQINGFVEKVGTFKESKDLTIADLKFLKEQVKTQLDSHSLKFKDLLKNDTQTKVTKELHSSVEESKQHATVVDGSIDEALLCKSGLQSQLHWIEEKLTTQLKMQGEASVEAKATILAEGKEKKYSELKGALQNVTKETIGSVFKNYSSKDLIKVILNEPGLIAKFSKDNSFVRAFLSSQVSLSGYLKGATSIAEKLQNSDQSLGLLLFSCSEFSHENVCGVLTMSEIVNKMKSGNASINEIRTDLLNFQKKFLTEGSALEVNVGTIQKKAIQDCIDCTDMKELKTKLNDAQSTFNQGVSTNIADTWGRFELVLQGMMKNRKNPVESSLP